jgi:hypothetical protein
MDPHQGETAGRRPAELVTSRRAGSRGSASGPTEAPPLARARSPAFDFAWRGQRLQQGPRARGGEGARLDAWLLCAFHVLVPDGVFTRADDDGAVVFREGPAPTRGDIADVAARVEKRMRRWLRRRGLLDERAAEDRSNEAPELSPLEACMQMSLFGSTYVRLAKDGAPVPLAGEEARFRAGGKGPWVAEASGFNVPAGVTVRSGDREGLDQARPVQFIPRPRSRFHAEGVDEHAQDHGTREVNQGTRRPWGGPVVRSLCLRGSSPDLRGSSPLPTTAGTGRRSGTRERGEQAPGEARNENNSSRRARPCAPGRSARHRCLRNPVRGRPVRRRRL